MPIYLRQSTASQEVPLGYFVDSTDGVTAETGLTISNTDIKVWKTGATTLADKNSGGATHIAGGIYYCVLDATDTNTIGPLVIFVNESGALPIRVECCVLDETVYDVMFGTTAPSTYAGADTSGTTTLLSRIGTPSNLGGGATVAANLADIEAQTDDIGAAGAGLTAIPWNASWDAEVQSECADALTAYDPPTRTEATADKDAVIAAIPSSATNAADVWAAADRTLTALDEDDTTIDLDAAIRAAVGLASANLGTQLNTLTAGLTIASGTIGSTGNSTTALHLTGLPFGNDELNDLLLVICDVSASEYHARWITDWADTGDLATVATLPFTPENGVDTYVILSARADVTGGSGLDAAGVRAALGFASASYDTDIAGLNTKIDTVDDFLDTEVAAILADTNELQTDWANGGRLDLLIDAIKASTDNLPSDPADASVIAGRFDTLDTSVADLPTNAELATALAGADDAVLAAIAALNNLSAAQVNAEVDTALADINLDHLVKNAVDTNFATTVHLDSVIGQIADNGTSATFDRTTDSLEALQAENDTTQSAIAALNNVSTAQVQSSAAAALTAYDPPTYAELVSEINSVQSDIAGLNDLSAAQVNAEVDTALADYDAPTKAELDSAVAAIIAEVDANETKIDTLDTVADAIKAKTDSLTFTVAGKVDANTKAVNDVTVAGTGASGDEWGPA